MSRHKLSTTMSTTNYMDGVPVKISEKYKPPPRIYQLPQATAHKLTIPNSHFLESSLYAYNFGLEKKVLLKVPHFRRLKDSEEAARRERKEQREHRRLQELKTKQKQLLGAINYPSAEEFSSTDSEEEEKPLPTAIKKEQSQERDVACSSLYINSFNNILQPTILPLNENKLKDSTDLDMNIITHAGNVINSKPLCNAFNYKDFEDDTSSPFDNIELKTINDLDILAQVLHNTQLNTKHSSHNDEENNTTKEAKEETQTENTFENNIVQDNAANLTIVENKSDILIKTDSINVNQEIKTVDIPNCTAETEQNHHQKNTNYITQSEIRPQTYSSYTQEQTNCLPYQASHNNLEQTTQQQQQQYFNYNMQYNNPPIFPTNGGNIVYYSPTHIPHYMAHNSNNYLSPYANNLLRNVQQLPAVTQATEVAENIKSKSVPDIMEELNNETQHSEMRRSRNHSYNSKHSQEQREQQRKEQMKEQRSENRCYSELEASAQKLAKNISSMGFPLERVAKIAKMYGTDDKKIIEHLIPLSELMDLGFDESAISAALIKCNNNKEKALEYLIS